MATEHRALMASLTEEFRPVLENSHDGVYLWLDDAHKVSNDHLARLFGRTIEEWRAEGPFLDRFVAEEDRERFSWHYYNNVSALAYPVTFRFRGLRKDGSTFAAETDMVPISWHGHAVA